MAYFNSMNSLNSMNMNFNMNMNVNQFGGFAPSYQAPPQAAQGFGGPQMGVNVQMLGQLIAQMLQVFSALQGLWSSSVGASGQFGGEYQQADQPHQHAPEAPVQAAPQASAAAALSVAVAAHSHEGPHPEPAKTDVSVAIAIQAQQDAEAAAAAAAAAANSGGGGDGGGGDGGDPIILDLNGDNKLDVTGADGSKINFNLFGNGTKVKTEWLKAGTQDGLLVSDFNGDGKIDSGRELMRTTGVNGEQGQYKGGWDKLSKLFDQNHDGKVAGQELDNLQVWVDKDGDGVSEDGELRSVKELGISNIDVPTEGVRSDFTINGKKQLAEDYVFDLEQ